MDEKMMHIDRKELVDTIAMVFLSLNISANSEDEDSMEYAATVSAGCALSQFCEKYNISDEEIQQAADRIAEEALNFPAESGTDTKYKS